MNIITKYSSNRKLYSNNTHKYVTSRTLKKMIFNNEKFIIEQHYKKPKPKTDATIKTLIWYFKYLIGSNINKDALIQFIKSTQLSETDTIYTTKHPKIPKSVAAAATTAKSVAEPKKTETSTTLPAGNT